MRIEGIDVDGFGCLSGSFRFSSFGLSVGSTPNEGGKSALGRAIATALYGPPKATSALGADDESDASWILLHVRLDDGTALSIARDLSRGTVQITDGAGIDRTASLLGTGPAASPGEHLLRLGREEFERAAIVSFDALGRLDGDSRLARLLGRANQPAPAPADAPTATDAPSPEETAPSAEAGSPAPTNTTTETAEASEPVEQVVARLRDRRAELDRLSASLEEKTEELRRHSAIQEELRGEVDRVGVLSGAEPADVEKLGGLLELLRKGSEKKDQLRREETRYLRELADRGLSREQFKKLRALFENLEAPDQALLESYRKKDTLYRGNQALLKSEMRFDETRLSAIDRAREKNARLSVWPFVGSAMLLLASIAMSVLSAPVILTMLVLLPAIGAATYGGRCLWLAKKLAEGERLQLAAAFERRKTQIAEVEKEQRYSQGRLAVLAEARSLSGDRDILPLYEEWKKVRGELRTFDGFERRRAQFESEIASIREKMGSFSIGGGANAGSLDTVDAWESLHRDYVRYFEAQRELEAAQDTANRIESDLALIETDRAAVRETIEEMLRSCGIDPSKNLDEAIERAALRAWTGEVVDPIGRPEPAFGIPAEEPDLEEAPWQALVSSRAEAIVRRFLPAVRAVEVGPRLEVSLQPDPTGPRLDAAAIERTFSPATRDLLAFAVRIAALEARSESTESVPVILDDPLVRVDDARYDRVLEFIVEDACTKGQVILLTCHEVRTRWFIDQRPALRPRIVSIVGSSPEAPAAAANWTALTA